MCDCFEAELILAGPGQQPAPDYGEMFCALAIKDAEGGRRLHLLAERADASAAGSKIESVGERFKRGAGSVGTADAHGQNRLRAVLATPVVLDPACWHG